MRWRKGRRSQNVEDRRGTRMSRGARAGGGGIGMIIIAMIAAYFFGVDPRVIMQGAEVLQGGQGGAQMTESSQPISAAEQVSADFTSVVLADTEDVWKNIFPQEFGGAYREPRLVLFSGAVQSACGFAKAAMGPFYCPGDQKVYIDLSFFNDLKTRFGAPGDFAQAYVVAHEVGHHIQTLLGVSGQVQAQRQRVSQAEGNALSVRQELQADCYAGVWAHRAHRARNILEQGDIEEGLNAATAIGDDRMQQQAKGYVTPESFTHGSSEQRVRWFRAGLESGDVKSCDTFSVRNI